MKSFALFFTIIALASCQQRADTTSTKERVIRIDPSIVEMTVDTGDIATLDLQDSLSWDFLQECDLMSHTSSVTNPPIFWRHLADSEYQEDYKFFVLYNMVEDEGQFFDGQILMLRKGDGAHYIYGAMVYDNAFAKRWPIAEIEIGESYKTINSSCERVVYVSRESSSGLYIKGKKGTYFALIEDDTVVAFVQLFVELHYDSLMGSYTEHYVTLLKDGVEYNKSWDRVDALENAID